MGSCGCCGQQIITWNEQRERELEDETVKDLLRLLGNEWKKAADNAVQLDLPDGFVTVIVRPFIKELG